MIRFKSLMGVVFLIFFFFSYACAQDWANLKRFQSAASVLETRSVPKGRVVFMGNSITAHWIQKSPYFFYKIHILTVEFSGQTTSQMLLRFQQDVIHLHPQIVVILGGTNDLAGNTGPSTLQMIKDNLISMVTLAKANGIKVILCSILPVYDYPWNKGIYPAQKIIKLNNWMQEFCKTKDIKYLNYYSSLVNDKGGMKLKYSKDGVHPNFSGYKIMESLIAEEIDSIVKKWQIYLI